jgi:four helix bundle protein
VPASVRSHRDLVVWRRSLDLAEHVYALAARFPPAEQFRLTSQITRSAVSAAANIAEGNARGSAKEYAHFLSIAKGSLMETEPLIIVARRLNFVASAEAAPVLKLITDISKMLTALRVKLIQRSQA